MEAAAVARPYAAAAFAYARQQDAIPHWQQTLAAMGDAVAALENTLATSGALVSNATVVDIALAAAAAVSGDATDEQKRFVALLAENNRVFALPVIAARFDELRRENDGVIRVRVESARAVEDHSGFNQYLEKRLGKKVEATYEENTALLGGVRIYVNDNVIDASIRGRLERLAATLSTSAVHSA